jgi:hypothetical protein
MSESEKPTEGPISLQEFEQRLSTGAIHRNTRVRMPDGREWMLLPSSVGSNSVSTDQIKRLQRLRRETAYRPVRWLVTILAWLCYSPCLALVFSEQFSAWLLRGTEGVGPGFGTRLGFALLLGVGGLLVQSGGAMLVDLFDLRLALSDRRPDCPGKNQGPRAQIGKVP